MNEDDEYDLMVENAHEWLEDRCVDFTNELDEMRLTMPRYYREGSKANWSKVYDHIAEIFKRLAQEELEAERKGVKKK